MTDQVLCGVCNHEVPMEHAQLVKKEEDGTFTCYHMGCEGKAKKLQPCQDCGHHRTFCNECKEL
jgi:hypothetical protein